jgi:peptidoglycan/LPS O-acetylase OafA/YrhL
MQTAGYSLFALAAGALITTAVTRGTASVWTRGLSVGWLRAFGKYSYSMYLVHLPVSRVMQHYVLAPSDFPIVFGAAWPGQTVFYVLATVPTFGVAWLTWHLFEARILKLKARFPY